MCGFVYPDPDTAAVSSSSLSAFSRERDVPASGALVFLPSGLCERLYTHAITQKYFVNMHIQSAPPPPGDP